MNLFFEFILCFLHFIFYFCIRMEYQELWHRLTPMYEPREAQAVVRTLLDGLFDMSLTDIVSGKVSELSAKDQQLVGEKMDELAKGEPVQYVIGYEWFAGRQFKVTPSVLIPRPETTELCGLVRKDYDHPFCGLQPPEPLRILDIGTGSGCIAITLALDIPFAEVSAWDISPDALLVARENARRLGAKVNLELHDMLDGRALPVPDEERKYEVIVSNPPYVCDKERQEMEQNVLDYEPGLALFVPDDDPLRFYRAIGEYAVKALRNFGLLYFECNRMFADDTADLLKGLGFRSAKVVNDQFGNKRFVVAEL